METKSNNNGYWRGITDATIENLCRDVEETKEMVSQTRQEIKAEIEYLRRDIKELTRWKHRIYGAATVVAILTTFIANLLIHWITG